MEINGLIIESVVVGSVGTNCYIVHKKDSEYCFVVDPGDSGDKIANYIRDQKMILDHILLTHGHFDHIQGVKDLKNAVRCEICALDVEKELLSDARMNVSAMTGRPEELEADIWLHDGQQFESAGITIKVIHTPGHTKGSCCYFLEEQKVLFSGDTLFMESVGRADLPTGNEKDLMQSVREKVLTLPSETKVFSGHGPSTSIEYEQANNPYA